LKKKARASALEEQLRHYRVKTDPLFACTPADFFEKSIDEFSMKESQRSVAQIMHVFLVQNSWGVKLDLSPDLGKAANGQANVVPISLFENRRSSSRRFAV
jgi:hypothetical protein